ncbi:MAG: hypothetical protein CM15mP12_5890 [Gammaproteobacteria bacterium]|nr:MAG: hypothetical protein CM15mP12_5890 [Gammaproteobacteria bacterium]
MIWINVNGITFDKHLKPELIEASNFPETISKMIFSKNIDWNVPLLRTTNWEGFIVSLETSKSK